MRIVYIIHEVSGTYMKQATTINYTRFKPPFNDYFTSVEQSHEQSLGYYYFFSLLLLIKSHVHWTRGMFVLYFFKLLAEDVIFYSR